MRDYSEHEPGLWLVIVTLVALTAIIVLNGYLVDWRGLP